MDKYKQKYLKYKNKYLQLKTQIGGAKKSTPNREDIEKKLSELRSKPNTEKNRKEIKYYENLLLPFLVKDQIVLVKAVPPREVNSVTPNHQFTGIKTRYNVNNIHYTQNTISHTFTDSQYNITGNIQKLSSYITTNNIKDPLNKDQLNKLFKADITTLDCIIDTRNIIYTCNNRRLCFLKQIHKSNLFDGNIVVNITNKCTHDIDVNQSVIVNMGNKPSWKC